MGANTKIENRYAGRSARALGISADEYRAKVADGLKWCPHCSDWRPRSEFSPQASKWDGLRNRCKASYRVQQKSYAKAGAGHVGMRAKKHSDATRAKMRASKSGAANNNWRGGITPAIRRARQHAAYQQWRKAVFARDGGKCRRCQCSPEVPHAHHILSFRDHPSRRLDVSNGLTLCEPCHQAVHREWADSRGK